MHSPPLFYSTRLCLTIPPQTSTCKEIHHLAQLVQRPKKPGISSEEHHVYLGRPPYKWKRKCRPHSTPSGSQTGKSIGFARNGGGGLNCREPQGAHRYGFRPNKACSSSPQSIFQLTISVAAQHQFPPMRLHRYNPSLPLGKHYEPNSEGAYFQPSIMLPESPILTRRASTGISMDFTFFSGLPSQSWPSRLCCGISKIRDIPCG